MKRIIYIIIIILLFSACKDKKVESATSNVYYTCSMDPQVVERKPGKCPICKMELTKTILSQEKDSKGLKLSDTQIKLANINVELVGTGNIEAGTSYRGTVIPSDQNISIISSKVSGRVDKLYFKTIGEKVKAGDILYEIYSEELHSAIQQYLLIKAKALQIKSGNINYLEMLKTAKNKLMILGLTNKQITTLKENSPNALIPFYSEVSGIINESLIDEGNYVSEGTTIFKIVDYSSVWIEMESYPNDRIHEGADAMVKTDGSNDNLKGKITFINPVLQSESNINKVRVEVSNQSGLLKPGMRVTVNLKNDKKEVVRVPQSAVLFEPNMEMVYVMLKDGSFQPKMVNIGSRSEGMIEIVKGLNEGEKVVVSGVYLLNSEYILRKGGNKGSLHNH